MPVSLSDREFDIIRYAASPLDESCRADFVATIMSALETAPLPIGEGTIHRMICVHQRDYWEPPVTNEGQARHSTRSKLRLGPAVL